MKLPIIALIAFFYSVSAHTQHIPEGYKLVYQQNFESKTAINDFEFTQPSKWLLAKEGNADHALEFTGKSDYEPPHRSPHTIALIKKLQVGSFVMEVDLLQTGKEYGHRDMCIVFGLQDAAHFYYSHIATKMDDNAHQIMLVNNEPRKKISTFTTDGSDWGENKWHKVRVERNVDSGSIKIFFNGVLVQEATDTTFGNGAIGFGSFDDSGKIDNIKIWSDKATKTAKVVFTAQKK